MMYSTPFILLALTLLLPVVTPRLFHGLDLKAHARQKRDYPQSKLELEELVEDIPNQKTESRNQRCFPTYDGRCLHVSEAAVAVRLPPQRKKECAFSLGNHCLTKMLDNAVSSLNYLQSGSSPGRKRRRRRRRSHLGDLSFLPRALLLDTALSKRE